MDPIEDYQSDGEEKIDYAQLNAARNRKQKKAGGWQSMGLDQPIFKAITRLGYKQPTQIQRKAIPLILDGRDVVGMSRTGSGKTAAFVVPILQRLKKREPCGFRALLLSPTRELALQTFKVVKDLGRFTGLRCACLVGGDNMDQQFSALHEHPDIIIATPGRFLHVVIEMNLKLFSVQYLVFDEADRLFEMGFAEQVNDIVKRVPDGRQTLLFSATLPKILVEFAKAGLSDPHLVRLDLDTKISDKLDMNFISCRHGDKLPALLFLCRWSVRTQQQTIVFCATMKHVEYIASVCQEAGLDNTFLYSQLDPTARKQNIAKFRNRQCMLLIVTDVAARGVDIPLLDVVINYQFPSTSKLFIHRVGRVARAGRSGTCFSLTVTDEMPYVVDLFLFLNRPVKFFGTDNEEPGDDIKIGRFPESLAHTELEFLNRIKEISTDIKDLCQRSENAMRKYERTRTQPSQESVRRVKREMRAVIPGVHPFFQQFLDSKTEDQKNIIQGIGRWRPNATIFEINSGSKQARAAVMKDKRKAHQRLIDQKKQSVEQIQITHESNYKNSSEREFVDEQEVVEVFGQVVKVTSFIPATSLEKESRKLKKKNFNNQKSENAQKHVSAAERREQEKQTHFISYVSSDVHRESVLAVNANNGSNFDREARQITIDINADDDVGMRQNQRQKVWDRKRKKYVTGDDQKVKKIRTEEGTWVPSSYKSGRYENWQKEQKLNFQKEDDDDNGGDIRRFNTGKNYRFNKRGGNKSQPRNELKNADQIMKQRRHKARIQNYQSHRRTENLKKCNDDSRKKFGGRSSSRGFHGKRRK